MDREYRRARASYLRAARQLARAMSAWEALQAPLLPGPGGELPAWTGQQIRAAVDAARAWQAVVTRRLEYESALREHSARR